MLYVQRQLKYARFLYPLASTTIKLKFITIYSGFKWQMNFYDTTNSYINYHQNAFSQHQGFLQLLALIQTYSPESLKGCALDIGCGNGKNTQLIREVFDGQITAIDASANMIKIADDNYKGQSINFMLGDIEQYSLEQSFHLMICNSVIHWFQHPMLTFPKLANHLLKNGILAIQTPLKDWCPFLTRCINNTIEHDLLNKTMKHYQNPWFHKESSTELYNDILALSYDLVYQEDICYMHEDCILADLLRMFNSGAAAAYFNPDNYTIKLPDNFKNVFLTILEEEISIAINQTGSDKLDIAFNRGYLLLRR